MKPVAYVKENFRGGYSQSEYLAPSVEMLYVELERGFADSFIKEEEDF